MDGETERQTERKKKDRSMLYTFASLLHMADHVKGLRNDLVGTSCPPWTF